MIGRCRVLLCLLAMALGGSGCWDLRDLNMNAFVLTLAMDAVGQDESALQPGTKSRGYHLTIEIFSPKKQRESATATASFMASAGGQSIDACLERIQTGIPRLINLDSVRVILLDETLAMREDFRDFLSFVEKVEEIKDRVNVFVVHAGRAGDVLQAKTKMEHYVAAELVDLVEYTGGLANESMGDLAREMRDSGGTVLVPGLTMEKKSKELAGGGSAAFKAWHMVGWLDQAETRQANWLLGRGNMVVEARFQDGLFTYLADHHSAVIRAAKGGRTPAFEVIVKTDGIIRQEQGMTLDLARPGDLAKVRKALTLEITARVRSSIVTAQKKFRADYLGFGRALARKDLKSYEQLDWNEVFPGVHVTVRASCGVSRIGMAR